MLLFCGTLPTYAVSTGAAAPASPFRRIDAARRKLLASISSYTTRDTKRPGENSNALESAQNLEPGARRIPHTARTECKGKDRRRKASHSTGQVKAKAATHSAIQIHAAFRTQRVSSASPRCEEGGGLALDRPGRAQGSVTPSRPPASEAPPASPLRSLLSPSPPAAQVLADS